MNEFNKAEIIQKINPENQFNQETKVNRVLLLDEKFLGHYFTPSMTTGEIKQCIANVLEKYRLSLDYNREKIIDERK